MSYNYINVKAVKQKAHAKGKRVSRSYLAYLDHKVAQIVASDCAMLGNQKTLQAEDIEAARAVNKTEGRP